MKTAVLQTRIDKTLKQDADAFFESIGMDTTTAIRIFLKQTLIQRKIPFEIVQDNSFYSEKNIKALEHFSHNLLNTLCCMIKPMSIIVKSTAGSAHHTARLPNKCGKISMAGTKRMS